MKKAFVHWSGGKDSALALHYIFTAKWYDVKFLFTTIDRNTQMVPIHNIPKGWITRQGMSLGIHTRKLYLNWPVDNETYQRIVLEEYKLMKSRGIDVCVFGDIHLRDIREFKEDLCRKACIEPVFPLWGRSGKDLVNEFLEKGYRARICATGHPDIPQSAIGAELTKEWVMALPAHIDPAGENGEYHTFVWNGPLFNHPVTPPANNSLRTQHM